MDGFGPMPAPEAKPKRRINVQQKGKAGEREAINIIKERMRMVEARLSGAGLHVKAASDDVQRNSLQSRQGGYDAHGIPIIALEIKRDEGMSLDAMWAQAQRQAKNRELPVLMWRRNKGKWAIRTIAALTSVTGSPLMWVVADLALSDFLDYYEKLYETHLRMMVNGN